MWSWKTLKKTLKLEKLDFYNSFTCNSWHLCFKFLGWQSNFPQGNGSRLHCILALFFFVFQKKCDNSKHTNLDFFFFFHCERQRTHLLIETFFLSLLFLAHVGSSQGGTRRYLFFFSSQCSTWRADQQAERAEWKGQRSQCSTAKDFTPQWHGQHPQQLDDLPPAGRHHIAFADFFFSGGGGGERLHSFDH